jgi:hypothetical protein
MLKVSTLIRDISVNVLHQLNRFTPTLGGLFATKHTTLRTTQTFLGLGEMSRVYAGTVGSRQSVGRCLIGPF